jgi:hypothetical protein
MIAEQVKFKPGVTMEPGLGPRVPAALAPTQSVFQPRTSPVKANGDAFRNPETLFTAFLLGGRGTVLMHACDRTEYGGMQGIIVMHLQFPRLIIACQPPHAGETRARFRLAWWGWTDPLCHIIKATSPPGRGCVKYPLIRDIANFCWKSISKMTACIIAFPPQRAPPRCQADRENDRTDTSFFVTVTIDNGGETPL